MIEKVSGALIENQVETAGKHLMLAVSGGADSMAMLHLFARNNDVFQAASVSACHFNHGLRGEESDRDEALVREVCHTLTVPLRVSRGNAASRPRGESVESYARKLRYAFFEDAMEGMDVLFTAHTMNDNAETVLFRLARGTGLRGATGIPVRRGAIVRPMLAVSRAEVERYCADNSVRYRDDATNFETEYARNFIRHEVLPQLSAVNRRAAEHIAQFARIEKEAADYIEREAVRLLWAAETVPGKYDVQKLKEADPFLRRQALKCLLERYAGGNITGKAVAGAEGVLLGAAAFQAGGNCRIVQRGGTIFAEPALQDCAEHSPFCFAARPGKNVLPGGRTVFIENCDIINGIERNSLKREFHNYLDCDKISDSLYFRSRMPGDTFTSARRGVTKTLKKLLNERGVPLEERRVFPVLVDADGIVWMMGEGVSGRAAPDAATGRVLKITVTEETGCGKIS